MVKGYKVLNPDWTCREKKYTCPGRFKEDVRPSLCDRGMHFCVKASDCFDYYKFDSKNHVVEVIAHGDVVQGDDKCCTNDLEIVREIPWSEVLQIVNEGKNCTGLRNTGDWNTGDRNTGDRNTGNRNTGDRNTGDRNTGDWNTGDWNTTSFSSGVFNTEEAKILMFNKPSDWSYRDWLNSDARYLLNQIPKKVVEWIYTGDMTDEEKVAHPEHETTGGYLKVLDESESGQIWWNGLSEDEKDCIRNIPNFDKDIFEEITGIRTEG